MGQRRILWANLLAAIDGAESEAKESRDGLQQRAWSQLAAWLRELRARRVAAGREPDDEANAPADMCCCGHCLVGPKPEFRDGCPLHPRPGLADDREVVDAEGRQLTTFSSRDSCGAVETGDLCGGCGSCIRMQAERSGHTVRPLTELTEAHGLVQQLEHHRETLRQLVVADSDGRRWLCTDLAIEETLVEREPWLGLMVDKDG
jgi:hypothetical protein